MEYRGNIKYFTLQSHAYTLDCFKDMHLKNKLLVFFITLIFTLFSLNLGQNSKDFGIGGNVLARNIDPCSTAVKEDINCDGIVNWNDYNLVYG